MADMVQINVPSDTVLDAVPERALKFFGGVSSNSYIRVALNSRGYTDEIHNRGWELLLKASGFRNTPTAILARPEAVQAIREIDEWDEPNFRVARAALVTMPEQLAFIFEGLDAQKGVASIASVTTFLDRLDELEGVKASGDKAANDARKATRKADKAAVDKLAERGINAETRKHLRGLLRKATGSPDPEALQTGTADPEKEARQKAEQREAKIALWSLLFEWSEIAKADIARRDHLILLGLAKRKVEKSKGKNGKKSDAKPEAAPSVE